MYTSSAAPNKRSLGAVYGLAQVATSIQYAVGPFGADWLFAFSLTHNVLCGDFAYVVFIGVYALRWVSPRSFRGAHGHIVRSSLVSGTR